MQSDSAWLAGECPQRGAGLPGSRGAMMLPAPSGCHHHAGQSSAPSLRYPGVAAAQLALPALPDSCAGCGT